MKKILSILLFIGMALSANAQLLWKISGKGLEKPSSWSVPDTCPETMEY